MKSIFVRFYSTLYSIQITLKTRVSGGGEGVCNHNCKITVHYTVHKQMNS